MTQSSASLIDALTRQYLKSQMLAHAIEKAEIAAEALSVDRELEARRLIRILLDETQSESVHADCSKWLEERS